MALALGAGMETTWPPKHTTHTRPPNPNDDLARHLSSLPAVKHGNLGKTDEDGCGHSLNFR